MSSTDHHRPSRHRHDLRALRQRRHRRSSPRSPACRTCRSSSIPDGTSTVTVTSAAPLDDAAVRAAIDEAGYDVAR